MKRETPLGLYKGLGAVVTGIVPKMAIRFTSFEAYKQWLADDQGHVSGQATFLGESCCVESLLQCAFHTVDSARIRSVGLPDSTRSIDH